ncbi:rod shape-determining protein MreC [Hydromonas duriensis]|uniref:Cell shape-determining protein MreC n=1 Tax=Hydromonas duriensis TaxID=1527608 RepID=A0A4R6YBJ6_9BURK|nr:rod shape-determining protein MreC [Hydromonas duriensis]TDR32971.1 rod shape-determining protein MreC [Hydromonas duriensis]
MKNDYQLFRRTTPKWARLVFASAFAIVLMLVDGKAHHLQWVRATISSSLGLVQTPLHAARTWFSDAFFHVYDLERLALDNQKLIAMNQEQAARLALLNQVEQDNNVLREQQGLKLEQKTPSLAAQVLYQVVDPYARKLVLNKGSQDGVVAGQPVITSKGLLGQITGVTPITSELTLILDTKINVPVQLEHDPKVRGFISGHTSEGLLSLRFFSTEVHLNVDNVFVTSGIDGLYPAGLKVGRVSKIDTAAEGSQSTITVVPTTEGMSTRYVLILQVPDVAHMAKRSQEQASQVVQDAEPNTLGAIARARAKEKQGD